MFWQMNVIVGEVEYKVQLLYNKVVQYIYIIMLNVVLPMRM